MIRYFLLLAGILRATVVHAEATPQAIANARWDQNLDKPRLIINVADLLTPSQRDIINSGFTTFTVFTVGETKDDDGQRVPILKTSCTVKYDTWEDHYDVTRLDPPPIKTTSVKEYKGWSHDCLEIVLEPSKFMTELESTGRVNGTLTIRQSTVDESTRIKSWLVKQQSGFMQGLYSHMLGNFQFQNLTRIRIEIPKRTISKSARSTP